MKRYITFSLLILVASVCVNAQNVIWSDDFEGDKGWQTFEFKKQYTAEYSKDGQLLMKSEDGGSHMSTCRTNLNPIKNFSISVEATPKAGLKEDAYFGLAFNVLDRSNYYYFCIEKGFAYFNEIKDGEKVRHDYDLVKNTKAKSFNLEIKKSGTTAIFLVNDEEVLYIESIDMHSSKVGLYVAGTTQVAFDNIEIKQ